MDRTPLQEFSELVAVDIEGPPSDPGAVEWLVIIEMIMTMIAQIMENCPQSDAGLREAVKRPTLWQRVQVRRVVKDNASDGFGLRWRNKANRIADSMLALAAKQDDTVIDAVIDQVRNSSV